jgi:hypothetical protein
MRVAAAIVSMSTGIVLFGFGVYTAFTDSGAIGFVFLLLGGC